MLKFDARALYRSYYKSVTLETDKTMSEALSIHADAFHQLHVPQTRIRRAHICFLHQCTCVGLAAGLSWLVGWQTRCSKLYS